TSVFACIRPASGTRIRTLAPSLQLRRREMSYVCQECHRKFKTTSAADKASRDGCRNCQGVDVDLDVSAGSTSSGKKASAVKFAKGEALHSEAHRKLVRFLRYEPNGLVVVADLNSMRELPERVPLDKLHRPSAIRGFQFPQEGGVVRPDEIETIP